MTEVLCCIRSCTYREDDHCRLNIIKIDGNSVAGDMNETLWASFALRGDARAEAGQATAAPRGR